MIRSRLPETPAVSGLTLYGSSIQLGNGVWCSVDHRPVIGHRDLFFGSLPRQQAPICSAKWTTTWGAQTGVTGHPMKFPSADEKVPRLVESAAFPVQVVASTEAQDQVRFASDHAVRLSSRILGRNRIASSEVSVSADQRDLDLPSLTTNRPLVLTTVPTVLSHPTESRALVLPGTTRRQLQRILRG